MMIPEDEGRLVQSLRAAHDRFASVTGPLAVGLMLGVVDLLLDVVEQGSLAPPPVNSGQPDRPVTFMRTLKDGEIYRAVHAVVRVGDVADDATNLAVARDALSTLARLIDQHLRDAEFQLPGSVIYTTSGAELSMRDVGPSWLFRTQNLAAQIPIIEGLATLGEGIQQAAMQVQNAKASLEASATTLADRTTELSAAEAGLANHALADQFSTLGDREIVLSWTFRGVTAALLLAAAALGVWGVLASGDLQTSIGHAALVLTVAGSSAYTGRLGSLHRVTGDWAKTIEVQLKTFETFLATVEGQDVKDRVYEEFGRRVLGPPPSTFAKNDGDEANGLTMPQLLQLLATVNRR